MKVRKGFLFPAILLVASLSTVICQRAFSAPHGYISLDGSGPIFSDPLKPGQRSVTVEISNYNNLNVGYDLIDQGDRTVIANGTITDYGSVQKFPTTLAGHTYKLRLRCQEPPWNNTKCNAAGWVDW